MFTISCYDVHPVVAKLQPIWRWAQIATDWLMYIVTKSCCRCGGLPARTSTTTDKDTMESYRSDSQVISSSSEAVGRRRPPAHSDTELVLRAQHADSSPDRLVTTDSGYSKTSHLSMSSGLSLDIEDAGGEPHGQLILDYNSSIGDTETNNSVTLQLLGMTSDSETEFPVADCGATGDHNQCALSLYSHGSETDLGSKTQPSNYGSSRENMSSGSYEQTSQDETADKSSQKSEDVKYYAIPPGYDLSSKASNLSMRSLTSPMSEPILAIAHSDSTVHDEVAIKGFVEQTSLGDRTLVLHTLHNAAKFSSARVDKLSTPEAEQVTLMTGPVAVRSGRASGEENNLPSVHTARKEDKGSRPELSKS